MSGILTGDALREIRKGLGLSQEQLGDLCGVRRGTASDWERDKFEVPLLVARVMRMLSVEPLLIYKLWPEAKPLIAPRTRQEEETATPGGTPSDGEVVLQGDEKGEPKPAEAVTATDAQSADVARRMAQIMKSLIKHGKGRK